MSSRILGQVCHTADGVCVCWLGNLGWLIGGQGRLIAFDLDLDHDLRLQPSPVSTADIAEVLDILLITHAHGDHFNAETALVLSEASNCKFVLPANCLSKAKVIGIPQERIVIARPGIAFDLLDIAILPIRALHGDRKHAVYRYANLDDCGYIVTIAGFRMLQPGDSVLLQDHLESQDIDVLFFSPTEHNTHIEDSLTLIKALQPNYIFPQHFGTYYHTEENLYWTRGYPDEVKKALPKPLQSRYHILRQGEVYCIGSNPTP